MIEPTIPLYARPCWSHPAASRCRRPHTCSSPPPIHSLFLPIPPPAASTAERREGHAERSNDGTKGNRDGKEINLVKYVIGLTERNKLAKQHFKTFISTMQSQLNHLTFYHAQWLQVSAYLYSSLPERCSPAAVRSPLQLFPDSSVVGHCSYCTLWEWFVPGDKRAVIVSYKTHWDKAEEEKMKRGEDMNVKVQRLHLLFLWLEIFAFFFKCFHVLFKHFYLEW